MTTRRAMLVLVAALCGAACSHPEKGVVDQYFNALRSGDSQTLSSFSAVNFDKKVDKWTIKGGSEAQKSPVSLPGLVQKVKDLETEAAAAKKTWDTYKLDHFAELDQVNDLKRKGAAIPPKLATAAAEMDKYIAKDREYKKALANARDAVEKERRSVVRSVGQVDAVETLEGEMIEKTVDLDLTIQGQTQPYVMTVRKYELKRDGGGQRVVSRWVIQNLQPKA
jgi:hypothetical protein